jgi:hypothetical protein
VPGLLDSVSCQSRAYLSFQGCVVQVYSFGTYLVLARLCLVVMYDSSGLCMLVIIILGRRGYSSVH